MASCLQDPSLMKGKGAEAAASEASAVAGKAEPDLIQSRNPPLTVVHRMPGSHIGKIINIIHLLSTERQRRRILDHIAPCAVILDQRFCRKRICISVLNGKTFRIGFFAVSDLIKRRKRHWVIGGICCFTFVNQLKVKKKMTSITPRLNRSREGRDGSYPLVIQIIRHRKKREIYTPYRFWEAEFNTRLEMVENVGGNRRRLLIVREANEYLIYIKKELEAICGSLEADKGSAYTVDDIVNVYNYHNDLSQVLVYADSVIAGLENKGRQGTAANYRSARRAFEMFLDGSPFSFEELTPEVLDRFVTFLRERGNRPNTVSFYLRQWRAIYNRACADHVVFSDQKPFRRLNLKEEVTSKRAISREKIAQIECVDLTACHADMQLARDLFLFSFYTRGMSFVDMCYLNKENLQGNYLRYKRQKTGQELQIRIEKDLRVLIDRYASSLSDYLLPMLRNGDRYQDYRRRQRRLNKLIRELGDRLQLDMPLTFYVARHSWATLAHENDVPVSVISDCMGHTSEKTTRIYLDRIDTKRLDRANRLVINSLR